MTFNPYLSVATLINSVTSMPGYVATRDQQRVGSYDVYDSMYWNDPGTFKVLQRGSEAQPIYLPTPRLLIDTINRFFMQDFNYSINPAVGDTAAQDILRVAYQDLFRREDFWVKFRTNKRNGLVRGDSMWHVVADPNKPQGSRISIYDLNPGKVFEIVDPEDTLKIVGYYIVEQVMEAGKAATLRQEYRKIFDGTGKLTGIQSSLMICDPSAWDERPDPTTGKIIPAKVIRVRIPVTMLDPRITSLPVYHIRNQRQSDLLWGISQLRGLEGIFGGVNQAETDGSLALALDGVGFYATTSGPPTDENGEIVPWTIGPGRVVELSENARMERVSGITSMDPFHKEIDHLTNAVLSMSGVPSVAAGTVAVQVSGLALQLEFSPLISMVNEKADESLGVYDHFLYDLQHGWMPVYESINEPDLDVTPIIGDPMPVDKQAKVAELLQLLAAGVVSVEYVQTELTGLGYDFPAEMNAQISQAAEAAAALNRDVFASRLDDALSGLSDEDAGIGATGGTPSA
jgi:hypothetical protein